VTGNAGRRQCPVQKEDRGINDGVKRRRRANARSLISASLILTSSLD